MTSGHNKLSEFVAHACALKVQCSTRLSYRPIPLVERNALAGINSLAFVIPPSANALAGTFDVMMYDAIVIPSLRTRVEAVLWQLVKTSKPQFALP